jgi:hypothetical protein
VKTYCVGEKRIACRVLRGNREGNRLLGKSKHGRYEDVRTGLKEIDRRKRVGLMWFMI